MKHKTSVVLTALLGVFALASAPTSAHSIKDVNKNAVKISGTVPGMGEHWANPKDLPLGPIYGTKNGKLVFAEFMMSQQDFMDGKSFKNLRLGNGKALPPVDHMDVEFLLKGHEGWEIPHYDIHMFFVTHGEHMKF
jgi:hypothetical protein